MSPIVIFGCMIGPSTWGLSGVGCGRPRTERHLFPCSVKERDQRCVEALVERVHR